MKKLLVLVLLVGCATTTPAPAPAVAPSPVPAPVVAPAPAPPIVTTGTPEPAPNAFAELEQRLLDAKEMHVRFHIETSGSQKGIAKGELLLGAHGLYFDPYGRWEGKVTSKRLDQPTFTDDDRKAILLGMTRMGFMHNIVKLWTAGSVDKEIYSAVTATDVTWDAKARKLAFNLSLNGQNAGNAELWLNELGFPTHRHQVVHFPQGDMTVEERYLWL